MVAAHSPLSFAKRPLLAGILNCTPDSFFDGGRFAGADDAVEHGLRMVREGADLLDVGGESTRPGSVRVGAAEQIARIEPVIRALRRQCDVPISVDTTLSAVAQAALAAGANIINDVSGGMEDPAICKLAAERGAGLVLMHRLKPPDQDRYSDQYQSAPRYGDVVQEVLKELLRLVDHAVGLGVKPGQIVLDPGFGFGKSVEQNFELLRRLDEIAAAPFPVLVSLSRKSFLGALCGGLPPAERLPATLAAAGAALRGGAAILRVHDVAEHRQFQRITAAGGGC
ncbi:MAG: dihydropteroate synthase [Planctomycetes bacterium]|nr:dihydropteroate synthase [Planctomycetota bacterium]